MIFTSLPSHRPRWLKGRRFHSIIFIEFKKRLGDRGLIGNRDHAVPHGGSRSFNTVNQLRIFERWMSSGIAAGGARRAKGPSTVICGPPALVRSLSKPLAGYRSYWARYPVRPWSPKRCATAGGLCPSRLLAVQRTAKVVRRVAGVACIPSGNRHKMCY